MSTQHFIVIGNPIAHSQSPQIHQSFATQVGLSIRYARQLCPNDVHSFTAVVEAFFNGGGVGANVTVPFKQMAYKLCHTNLTPHAQVAGAVNTLYMQNGKLFGHNTDGQGLVNHIQNLGWALKDKNIAIIGAGGASRGIILPLLAAGVSSIHVANRTVTKAEALIEDCQKQANNLPNNMASLIKQAKLSAGSIEALTGSYDVIINATSIGLSGDKLPLADTLSCTSAYDMMYGRDLPFLQHFEDKGANVSDGKGMLIGQAALSFEQWTGKKVDVNTL